MYNLGFLVFPHPKHNIRFDNMTPHAGKRYSLDQEVDCLVVALQSRGGYHNRPVVGHNLDLAHRLFSLVLVHIHTQHIFVV